MPPNLGASSGHHPHPRGGCWRGRLRPPRLLAAPLLQAGLFYFYFFKFFGGIWGGFERCPPLTAAASRGARPAGARAVAAELRGSRSASSGLAAGCRQGAGGMCLSVHPSVLGGFGALQAPLRSCSHPPGSSFRKASWGEEPGLHSPPHCAPQIQLPPLLLSSLWHLHQISPIFQ